MKHKNARKKLIKNARKKLIKDAKLISLWVPQLELIELKRLGNYSKIIRQLIREHLNDNGQYIK